MRQTGRMARGTGLAGPVLGVLTVLCLAVGSVVGGPTSRAGAVASQVIAGQSSQTSVTSPPTLPGPTIAPLGNRLPLSPATIPLRTRSTSAHVSPAFAYVSVAGFAVAILIVLGRMFSTRPGGLDRRPVPFDMDVQE